MSKKRRQLGAYYTPKNISLTVAEWAIRGSSDKVIDPTFGGCSFIESSLKILKRLGNQTPEKNIFGCDVDPTAFEHLRRIVPTYSESNFVFGDFFEFSPDSKFEVVLGNPPYIKYDNIPTLALERARRNLPHDQNVRSLVRPNYWVYFVISCLHILSEGGRMALVLPSSFLAAHYSQLLKSFLQKHFERIDIFPLIDKIFEGTNETTVIVLFSNYSTELKIGELFYHDSIASSDVKKSINAAFNLKKSHRPNDGGLDDLLRTVETKFNLKKIGDFYDVRIGVVTGAKEFFILEKEQAVEIGIDEKYLRPVFSRARDLNKIIIREDDIEELPLALIIPDEYRSKGLFSDPYLDSYLDTASDSVRKSYHARHRNPWYSLRRVFTGDSYLKNINSGRVFIYSNHSSAICTNNIIRLNLKHECNKDLISLFSMTSLFQLSAFNVGIRYGKKALKLDPYHVSRILLPYHDSVTKEDVTLLSEIANRRISEAEQTTIDEVLLIKYLKFDKSLVQQMRGQLHSLIQSKFS